MVSRELPHIDTIILAGSVLKPDFSWSSLSRSGRVRTLVNDCAIDDNVLLLSQLFVLFTGMAGRIGFYGFSGDQVVNRFFHGGHSLYFGTSKTDDSFMIKYWLPLLSGVVEQADERNSSPIQGVIYTLLGIADPIKLLVYSGLLCTAGYFGYLAPRQLAAQQALIAQAAAIDDEIRGMGLDDHNSIRRQALLAIHSWRLHPTAEATQFLARTMSLVNLHSARFHLSGEDAAVSDNGRWLISYIRTKKQLVIATITSNKISEVWSAPIDDSGDGFFVVSLAVSSDGRNAAALVDRVKQDNRSRQLQVFSAPSGTAAPSRGKERFRIGGTNVERYLSFKTLRFDPSGHFLWGTDYSGYTIGLPERFVSPLPLLCRLGNDVTQLPVPPPPMEHIERLDVAVDSDRNVAVLSKTDVKNSSSPNIVIYSLGTFSLVKSMSGLNLGGTGVSFSPDGDDLVITGGEALYSVIHDWRSKVPSVTTVPLGNAKSLLASSSSPTFLAGLDAIVIHGSIARDQLEDTAPFAFIFGHWKYGSPRNLGLISNLGTYINAQMNVGDFTSIGVQGPSGPLVTVDYGNRLTEWEAAFRFGKSHLELNARGQGLTVPAQGGDLLLTDRDYGHIPDGQADYNDRVISIGNWRTSRPAVHTVFRNAPGVGNGFSLTVSSDGKLIVALGTEVSHQHGGRQVVLRVYSLSTKQLLHTLYFLGTANTDSLSTGWGLNQLQFGPASDTVLAMTNGGHLNVWRLEGPVELKPTQSLLLDASHTEDESFRSLVFGVNTTTDGSYVGFDRDGRALAISRGAEVEVLSDWQTPKTSSTIRLLMGQDSSEVGDVSSIAVSPDSSLLAAGTTRGIVRVWRDWRSKAPVLISAYTTAINREFELPARVLSLAFDPSGSSLAILDRLNLQVIGIDDPRPSILLPYPSDPRKADDYTVQFSMDGRYVIVAGGEPETVMYSIWRPEDLISTACESFLLADLTASERTRYLPKNDRDSTCPALEVDPKMENPIAD